jgi:hypothetical protein
MRMILTVLAALGLSLFAQAQDSKPAERYGIEPNLPDFPQASPKETLSSVLKALEQRRIGYLLAQLADPEYVDMRVKKIHGGKFDAMVEEVTAKLANDPGAVKKLRRFLDEGTWDIQDAMASARLKDVTERVYLRKVDGRWYFENQHKSAETKRE